MNTPKSQNPEGKVVAVGYISPEALAALNVCRNDEHNGCADIWMRPVNVDDVPLIPATALADAERRAQYWKGEHLAGNTVIDAMQRRLEAALAIADRVECHDFDHLPTIANELRTLLRGDGKGEGDHHG